MTRADPLLPLLVWAAVLLLSGALVIWPTGRFIEARWPALSTPTLVALGLAALFVSWTAAIRVAGPPKAACTDIFNRTDGLDRETRSELLARCIATAGPDEIEPAVVLRRYPQFYPFAAR